MSDAVDPRNELNDLPNTEWMIHTKSVWFSTPPQREKQKRLHPATFAESDVVRLIQFFTKRGARVLDPFVGTGSTLVACAECGRSGVGIELIPYWADIARSRLPEQNHLSKQTVICGDARDVLPTMDDETFDFVVTSPPYWNILRKDNDHKVRAERRSKGLHTRYSDHEKDLGNIASYEQFLKELGTVFGECRRVLKKRRYMCVIVSDFRHKSRFIAYHADLAGVIESVGCTLEGITILVQNNKNLYPYGIPYAFVSNIHHHYVLVFRRRS